MAARFLFIAVILIVGNLIGDVCPERCERNWIKIGCFHDRIFPNRPYPFELVNHRDPINNHWDGNLINWRKYPDSIEKLACICANKTRSKGYQYFGLQFYGECWSGPTHNFHRDGPSTKCIGNDFKPCDDSSKTECVGRAFTNYIYKLSDENPKVDGKWSEWEKWSPCSATCGYGERYRERFCSNPEPENGGQTCEGEAREYEECNHGKCETTCDKEIDFGIALDYSSSVRQVNWNRTLDFVVELSKGFNISPEKVHFGVLSFSHRVRFDFGLSDKTYWNSESFEKKIKSLDYRWGYTWTDRALKKVKKLIFCEKCGLRKDSLKYLLVFTDGRSNNVKTNLKTVSDSIKDMGVNVISVGAGHTINHRELEEIATDDKHVFYVGGYAYLGDNMNAIRRLTCG